MVEQPHVHQFQGLFQTACPFDVGRRRFGRAAGVVVCHDQRVGVMVECQFHHFAHIHCVFRHCAARQFHAVYQAVLAVEQQYQRNFHPFVPQVQAQEVGGRLGAVEQCALLQLLGQHPPSDFAHHGKLGETGLPHAFMPHQFALRRVHQPSQAAEFV